MKPSNDPKADELRNKNLSAPNETPELEKVISIEEKKEENQNGK